MTVISLLNQKGGVGKTTISTHLATALHLAGHSVTLIDTDPQGSSRDWAAVRDDHPFPVVGIDRPTIERDIKALAPADFYIIDGAPRISELAVSAIKASDFVLIPVQPSPWDIWATADLVELVKTRISITDGKLQAAFVVSRQITGSNLGKEIDALLDGYGLPVMLTRIFQRVDYVGPAARGMSAVDALPMSDAATEIDSLMNELLVRVA